MPIYEYKCLACGKVRTEFVQGFKDPEGLTCNACGSNEMKKVISKVSYHQSQADRVASYDPRSRHSDSYLKDTRNIGLHAEHMLRKSGVKPTEDFEKKLEKLRTDPSRVIKDEDV